MCSLPSARHVGSKTLLQQNSAVLNLHSCRKTAAAATAVIIIITMCTLEWSIVAGLYPIIRQQNRGLEATTLPDV